MVDRRGRRNTLQTLYDSELMKRYRSKNCSSVQLGFLVLFFSIAVHWFVVDLKANQHCFLQASQQSHGN